MTPILQQFIAEGRDFLQSISQKLLELESAPKDADLMSDLFRSVHTLKGNSGLFDFPEMTRVLHAAEDLMTVVREGHLAYSQLLADRLLDAMDFVGMLLDEIEVGDTGAVKHAAASVKFTESLRELLASSSTPGSEPGSTASPAGGEADRASAALIPWNEIPPSLRDAWSADTGRQTPLLWVTYTPEAGCFFKGEDPFHQARQVPQLEWHRITSTEPWPALADLDPFHCMLKFELVTSAPLAVVELHFRYVPEQVVITTLFAQGQAASAVSLEPQPVGAGVLAAANAESIARKVISAQLAVLSLPDPAPWFPGRMLAAAATLRACLQSIGQTSEIASLDAALEVALAQSTTAPMLAWMHDRPSSAEVAIPDSGAEPATPAAAPSAALAAPPARRSEDHAPVQKTLKVDQEKIDRLMSLIGEMVVAKNGLPFLASRAERVYGSRDLSREIKSQHAVINRIAEEMQDVIMQVRMTPVSSVFQRFPRLVRDISRKLGKQVSLVLEGEDTEADKNIIEALADPLIHIVRNSLDHGIEQPEARTAAGKSAEGRLVIRASQEADRVLIDISDDGKGIDPAVIKRKAYEKGIIDEATLERISDHDAVNLVFAAGFSTAEQVSDLSGRGVGMDVVRTAVEQVNGTVTLDSVAGEGTRLRLSLPLSIAITNVMIVESNKQIFGVPMDMVVETVRVPRADVRLIKNRQTTVLRNRLMPLRSLNELLAANEPQISNSADEMAALVVQIQGEQLGLIVDDFREVAAIILKPMTGILGGLPGYSGSALLGDGSVLMVLNPKELVSWA
jgi:two-component system chemotaxis sensor kinase CheA